VALAEAFAHLAAPATDVPASPTEVLEFAHEADDATWAQAEALAGTRPASFTTRTVVLANLARTAASGPFVPPALPADPLAGLPR
jgi:hypothetical protein